MQSTHRLASARSSVLSLAIGLTIASSAPAATMNGAETVPSRVRYSTSGSIGMHGLSGPGLISFNSVADETWAAPSSLSLGEFLLAPVPSGVSATYAETPFRITFLAHEVDGERPAPDTPPPVLSGVLNGRVSGAGQSDVVATFDALTGPVLFQAGGLIHTLDLADRSLSLVPSTSNGGRTTARAQIAVGSAAGSPPLNTPEPAALVVFLTSAVGLALHRRADRPGSRRPTADTRPHGAGRTTSLRA